MTMDDYFCRRNDKKILDQQQGQQSKIGASTTAKATGFEELASKKSKDVGPKPWFVLLSFVMLLIAYCVDVFHS